MSKVKEKWYKGPRVKKQLSPLKPRNLGTKNKIKIAASY
jgi:hypothetical protein